MFKSSQQLTNKPLFPVKELIAVIILFTILIYLIFYIAELESKLKILETQQQNNTSSQSLKLDKTINKPPGKG